MKTFLLAILLSTCVSGYCLLFPTPVPTNANAVTPSATVPFLQNISNVGPNSNIQLAVSSSGAQAAAVWTNFPNQIEIVAAYYNPCFAPSWIFLTPQLTGFGSGTIALGSSPKVGVDGNGNVFIIYISPNGFIIANRYGTMGQLISSHTISAAGNTSNISPSLFVQDNGIALVVWIQSIPYQILCTTFNPNTTANFGWSTVPQIFMPFNITTNGQAISIPSGIYPAAFAIKGNADNCPSCPCPPNPTCPCPPGPPGSTCPAVTTNGISVWIDGPTGQVRAGTFIVP